MTGRVRTEQIDVRYVARLARLNLTEAECARFQAQLDQVVNYVRKIREPDTAGIEPTSHAHPLENVFREDAVEPGLDRETVLANAPRTRDGLFIVPRIVE
ncbi:MAG: Asp-tRNA(Asn)/Glu-tRNA(Gln) amidotransferase subunit GatC [Lentisphaerae bacterium]|nr:Asp-tRNA(Asn)/Glu-tRNA(Gln) amidotransferase subunit GatC [Lentisphaerota bacterium]